MDNPEQQYLFDREHISPAPNDWWIIITDIKGSTDAVKAGRSRAVNLVGSAAIAAIRNEFSSKTIPYTFGGDGATFLVPPGHLDRCLELLASVRSMAKKSFQFDLRIGLVSVKEVLEKGGEIFYGFVEWNEVERQPFFRGSGFSIAEDLVKKDNRTLEEENDSPANIEGLSCRVLPFKSIRGQILSVIIDFKEAEKSALSQEAVDETMGIILGAISQNGNIEELCPLKPQNMKRRPISSSWKNEIRMRLKSSRLPDVLSTFFDVMFEHLATFLIFSLNLKNSPIDDPDTYSKDMIRQSDWLKMEGGLKMVIDVNEKEKETLLQTLTELEKKERIDFGVAVSPAVVMTCHFQSGVDKRHVHFIDGSDGGLTRASIDLKSKG